MSTTITDLPFAAPSQTEAEPSAVRDVDPSEVEELSTDQAHTGPADFAFTGSSRMRPRPTRGPLAVTQVEGECIVSDLMGAVYGAGATYDEARAEYWHALDAHLAFLRAREGVLHRRLRRELAVLTRLFPDH